MPRRGLIAAVAAFVVALLPGCGDDDAGDAGGAVTTTATSAGGGSGIEDGVVGADEYVSGCFTERDGGSGIPDLSLCVGDLAGNVRVLADGIAPGVGPAVSPDGTRVVVQIDDLLRVVPLDGGPRLDLGLQADGPVWLDNDRIAYRADGAAVHVVAADASPLPPLVTAEQIAALAPSASLWSFDVSPADGAVALSVNQGRAPGVVLALAGPDGGPIEQLPSDGLAGMSDLTFSPDGSMLAFAADGVIHVRDLRSGADTTISPANWSSFSPAWSPDGTELLWAADRADVPEGPRVLVRSRIADPAERTVVAGSHGAPAVSFPATPHRPRD